MESSGAVRSKSRTDVVIEPRNLKGRTLEWMDGSTQSVTSTLENTVFPISSELVSVNHDHNLLSMLTSQLLTLSVVWYWAGHVQLLYLSFFTLKLTLIRVFCNQSFVELMEKQFPVRSESTNTNLFVTVVTFWIIRSENSTKTSKLNTFCCLVWRTCCYGIYSNHISVLF